MEFSETYQEYWQCGRENPCDLGKIWNSLALAEVCVLLSAA